MGRKKELPENEIVELNGGDFIQERRGPCTLFICRIVRALFGSRERQGTYLAVHATPGNKVSAFNSLEEKCGEVPRVVPTVVAWKGVNAKEAHKQGIKPAKRDLEKWSEEDTRWGR